MDDEEILFEQDCAKTELEDALSECRAEYEEKITKLREALEPLANLPVTRFMTDGLKYEFRVDAKDIRRGRAVLKETEN